MVIRAEAVSDIRPALAEVERLTRDRGLHAIGFLTYEAGAAFGLTAHAPPPGIPLLWFGLYETSSSRVVGAPQSQGGYTLGTSRPTLERDAFRRRFERIKQHLSAGDSYQVNLTLRVEAAFEGDPFDLFADLVEAQQGTYSCFLDIGDLAICSASPELFFAIRNDQVLARPMKGTTRRGLTIEEDRELSDRLRQSNKDRAENVMVVDMVRNDLGRVADVGSIRVPELFSIERYPGVWQMTSLVTARTLASLDRLVAALHPSASITGAPKVRTMEILRDLEDGPRGIYTGAIGRISPSGDAHFNVAIRTAIVDRLRGRVEFGVGSGIVWDSEADAEYDECLLKAAVLGRRPVRFDLLETLRWQPDGGYLLLEEHLARLQGSAEYFGIALDAASVRRALDQAVAAETAAQRVRLLVSRDGAARTEKRPHRSTPGPLRVKLAASPIDAANVWLYHKTTHRSLYDAARAAMPGCDEVLLWNVEGQLTEATTANLVLEIDGARVTPPVRCGLLPGTCRAAMIASGAIREAVLTREDLNRATGLWLINAVHEARPAVLVS
ncbi:MAG: aminodeoxychorismate synthase component I [Vicinamibacterales bacterium]